jgi:ComF family protein
VNGSTVFKSGASWRSWGSVALDVLFPRTCAACRGDLPRGDGRRVCRPCWDAVPVWTGLACDVCGLPLPDGGEHCHACRRRRRAFDSCRSAGLFDGSLRACLLGLKYHGRDDLAAPLAGLLLRTYRDSPSLGPVDAALPVPMGFWRRHARGYNQAEELAAPFCRAAGLPLLRGALVRRRTTRSQTALDREQRWENVRGAFRVARPQDVRGRRLLLIDDVCTTGATLEACAEALKEAGAKRVYGLTVARQV